MQIVICLLKLNAVEVLIMRPVYVSATGDHSSNHAEADVAPVCYSLFNAID